MNRSLSWTLLIHVVALGWLGWNGDAHAVRREHRSAMVVGMSDYYHLPPLHTSTRDAKATAQHLEMTRFETTWTADLTKARFDAEIEAFVRARADTIYHPVGSCRMGRGALDVVDAEGRTRRMRFWLQIGRAHV